ncbi:TonB-dependent receptor [Paraflavitalea sp. CAU 1676]|uniref:TonB-dependent receptor n=1 Tax=Paraflavitalea sp. CAU 1676 TaxID=3032598 RepID=UPI0023DB140E|nr:TonB-dependent receptor [Paraflavitalea sp. CAU 1676]MDF2193715.1 TonB-dependent receptor [Paraflavitalea sp. CAU 1676]
MRVGLLPVVLITCLAGISYAAPVVGQDVLKKRITLTADQEQMKNILREISKRADVKFVYISPKVPDHKKVSIAANNEELKDVLDKLLHPLAIRYEVVDNQIILKPTIAAAGTVILTTGREAVQPKPITGKVIDEKGAPVGGVSITVKGTQRGTSTAGDGSFTIEATQGEILECSMVGYKSLTIVVGTEENLNISLQPDATGIGEVVVIGYGTQKKANLTGAINSVDAAKLANRPVTSVQNALQGIAPGLTVLNRPGDVGNDVATITVRGRTNLTAPGPMIIIDGIPASNRELAALNPNEIANMSVLKDASSASIYGSRAANGVILVTTKKGTSDKLSIDINASYGTQSPTRIPEYLGASDYAMLYNEAMKNAGKQPKYSAEALQKFASGSDRDLYPNTDWYDQALVKNPVYREMQAGISGSSKTTRFYLSLAALNQGSLVQNKDYSRYTVRLNTESQVLPILKIGSNIAFIKSDFDTKGGELNWVSLNRMVPTMASRHSDGTWGTINGGSADATLAKDNPLRNMAEAGKRWNRDHNIQTAINATLTPLKGLTVTGLASLKYDNRQGWIFINELPALVNFITKATMPSTVVTPNEMQERWSRQQSFLVQGYAEYEKKILDHSAKLMVGASQESNINRSIYAGRKRFPNNDLGTVGAGSSAPEDISSGANSSSNTEWAIRSYFGRFNYAYAGKYLLEANLRIDKSSRFHPDYRTATFPSFSAGWRLSEEGFMKNISWLNDLKVRGSWGILGNQDNVAPGNYFALLNTGYAYNFDGTSVDGVWQTQGTNIMASWEKVHMTNVGVDMSMWNGKLSVTADYFIKTTKDILLNRRAPATYGLTAPTFNLGSTENKGIELLLSHNNSIGRDFSYNVSFNFTKLTNTILNLGDDKQRISSYWIEKVGESVGSFYGYEAMGLFKDAADVSGNAFQSASTKPGDIKYKDQNKDNKIDANDRVILGNDVPSFTYGFNLGASWKGFDVSALFYGVAKVKVYLDNEASFSFFNGAGVKPLHLQRWTTENPNPNAAYPRVLISADGTHNYNNISSFWLFNGAYLRVRNLSLGYTIPATIAKKAAMQNARIYVAANNPFTIMADNRLTDYDPEVPSGRGGYPGIKTWVVGLNVKF